jgi:ABC-type amino acid transport substrate-binding protein
VLNPPRTVRGVVTMVLTAAVSFGIAACATPPAPDTGATPARAGVREAGPERAAGPVVAPTHGEARTGGRAVLTFLYVPAGGFAYRDDDGRLTGVTVELLRDFARFVAATDGLDVHITWLEEPVWSDFYRHVSGSRGGVFGIGNVTITEARRDELDFSPPYLNNVAVLVTHERVPELGRLEEIAPAFAGLTALPYPGTLHEARLHAIRERWLPDLPVRPVASNDELIALLASDGPYFGYVDVYNYWRARQAGLPLRRHAAGDDGSETFGVILPRGSDWTPVIAAFFEADGGYVRGARFRSLLRQHLGDELAALLAG